MEKLISRRLGSSARLGPRPFQPFGGGLLLDAYFPVNVLERSGDSNRRLSELEPPLDCHIHPETKHIQVKKQKRQRHFFGTIRTRNGQGSSYLASYVVACWDHLLPSTLREWDHISTSAAKKAAERSDFRGSRVGSDSVRTEERTNVSASPLIPEQGVKGGGVWKRKKQSPGCLELFHENMSKRARQSWTAPDVGCFLFFLFCGGVTG